MKSANLFLMVLYFTKRKCSPIEPQLKLEKKDEREAPKKPSIKHLCIYGLTINFKTLRKFLFFMQNATVGCAI